MSALDTSIRREPTIVTVVNSVGATSMPLNEFVLYRSHKIPNERHIIISLESVEGELLAKLESNGVAVIDCGGRTFKFARLGRSLLAELDSQEYPTVVHLHHPRSALVLQLTQLAKGRKIPTLFTVHNMFERYSGITKLMSFLNFLMADFVSFVSHASYQSFPLNWGRKGNDRTCIVSNGVDLERIDHVIANLKKDSNQGEDVQRSPFPTDRKIINIGKMLEQKNQSWLLRLLAELPESVTLTIIGDGPLRGKLEHEARDLGIRNRIRFTGRIPREKVYEELYNADIFLSSSSWEGLPVAVLEAMALGLPVVLSDIKPHREIAQYNSNIRLISFDLERWVTTLEELISMPNSKLASIGDQNRSVIESSFSLRRMHQEYSRIYRALWGLESDQLNE